MTMQILTFKLGMILLTPDKMLTVSSSVGLSFKLLECLVPPSTTDSTLEKIK
jgi:hypothetical protein